MPYKLMFDTSVFNFIHDHELYSHVESFFAQNKDITVYICDTQVLEIESISDIQRKDRIKKLMQDISVETVICSLGFVGSNKSSNRIIDKGFRVGKVRVADMDDSKTQEMKELKRDKADATVIDTAITGEMDHLVTADKKMKALIPKRLEKVRIYSRKHRELKIELIRRPEKDDLMNFLRKLSASNDP
jgi:predicted nucleic acid-binding protein